MTSSEPVGMSNPLGLRTRWNVEPVGMSNPLGLRTKEK